MNFVATRPIVAAIALLGAAALPLAASVAADSAASVQLAQSSNPPATPAPGGRGDPQLEARITDLHKKLKITPQQEQQFSAFADAMRANTEQMQSLAQQAGQKQGNAVEDLRTYLQLTEAQAEGLKRLLAAFEPLYNSLNDQQKKAADQALGRAAEQGQPRQSRPGR